MPIESPGVSKNEVQNYFYLLEPEGNACGLGVQNKCESPDTSNSSTMRPLWQVWILSAILISAVISSVIELDDR